MNFLLILNRAAEFSPVIPGIIICLIPVTKWIHLSPKKLSLTLIAAVLIFCFASGFACVKWRLYPSFFFVPCMCICIAAYFYFVKLEKRKLLYLFFTAVAALSFGGIANDIAEAKLVPDKNMHGFFVFGLIIQLLVSYIIMILIFIIRHKITWLFENVHAKQVWYTVWLIPALIIFCNFSMVPKDYANVSVGKIFYIYLIIDISLFLFFFLFQIMFYMIAKISSEKSFAEKTALMYEIQVNQYESLKSHMEQTSRMRHDFKHVMAAVSELLQNRQYEELQRYAADYHTAFSDHPSICNFCQNSSVNAILSYYAEKASENKISVKFQVQVPKNFTISDIDLCILFGNLLDNAVYSCKVSNMTEPYIHLTADTDIPGSLYIAMANSFDGKVKQKENHFLSTKANGSGIGLSSIRTIAEKYHGMAEFYTDHNEFISNIMMKFQ